MRQRPRRPQERRRSWAAACGAILPPLLVGVGITVAGRLVQGAAPHPVEEAPPSLAAASLVPDLSALDLLPAPSSVCRPGAGGAAPGEAGPAEYDVIEGALGEGDTLFAALTREDVPPALADRIGRVMGETFDFRNARPGHSYRLARSADGGLVSFHYQVSELERYQLVPTTEEWRAERQDVPLERRRARLAGIVTSSLYEAVQQLGESPQLAKDLADVFAWDVDFSRASQPGDEFRVVYERLYLQDPATGEETYVRPGRILAARYRGAVGEHAAVYFETDAGRGGYYRPDGSSMRRQFLVAPVRYTRISSSYSAARLHPILKVRRPHPGIDYAAPHGTPVSSVADGKVIYRGWSRGFGRLVKVRHTSGYVSYYGHLSRFAKGLSVGSVVRQKQVIGYVGQSGLATGPHVCFRIAKDGRYVNPVTLRAPAGDPVPAGQRLAFEFARDEILSALGPQDLVATDEAL